MKELNRNGKKRFRKKVSFKETDTGNPLRLIVVVSQTDLIVTKH